MDVESKLLSKWIIFGIRIFKMSPRCLRQVDRWRSVWPTAGSRLRFDNQGGQRVRCCMQNNPFLDNSFLIAWSKLAPEHIEPAIETVLTTSKQAITNITVQDLGGVSYESTFAALEKASEILISAWGKVSHLQSVCDSPAYAGIFQEKGTVCQDNTPFSVFLHIHIRTCWPWGRLHRGCFP